MFLIKIAFWLSLLILILPAEPPDNNVHLASDAQARPELSGSAFIEAARMTVNDISGICQRQPEVCVAGSAALDVFMRKAQYGAKLVMRAMSGEETPQAASGPAAPLTRRDKANERVPAREASTRAGKTALQPVSQNTLTQQDLEPRWRDPKSGGKA